MTFEHFLISRGLSERTVRQRVGYARRIEETVQPFNLINFNAFIVLVLKSKGKVSANAFVKACKLLCEYYQYDWGKDVKGYTEPIRAKILLTDEEITNVISCDESDDLWTVYWSCLAYSGARTIEIASLTVNDIDLVQNVFIFRDTKTGDDRIVPIAKPIQNLLQEYTRNLPSKFLFTKQGNKPIDGSSWEKNFKKRLKLVGIQKDVKPYSFRHSFITRLLSGGAVLFDVQNIVGHKKSDTTRRYYRYSIDTMRKALNQDKLMRHSLTPDEKIKLITDNIRQSGLLNDEDLLVEIFENEGELQLKVKAKHK